MSSLLLVNSGSSSLKVSLVSRDGAEKVASAVVDWVGAKSNLRLEAGGRAQQMTIAARDSAAALREVMPHIRQQLKSELVVAAVGHRVVHGGEFSSAVFLTDEVIETLKDLSSLAPLHNPPSLEAIVAAQGEFPDVPHIAVFDTAFHRGMRPEASQYALPQSWTVDWRIKRYGFHGLSYSYCAGRAAEMLEMPANDLRLIICHLGHGCSAAAVMGGRSQDTTMGFTPLEGLMMATRCGNIDAGALLYAQNGYGFSVEEVSDVLNHQSGLLGVSGVSEDMRQVISSAESGNENSRLAINMFCYRVQQAVAAMMVPLGGADALIFTAGIGEHSPYIREQVCRGLAFLGFSIDSEKNKNAAPDLDISVSNARQRVLVIATREEISMAREVRAILETLNN